MGSWSTHYLFAEAEPHCERVDGHDGAEHQVSYEVPLVHIVPMWNSNSKRPHWKPYIDFIPSHDLDPLLDKGPIRRPIARHDREDFLDRDQTDAEQKLDA